MGKPLFRRPDGENRLACCEKSSIFVYSVRGGNGVLLVMVQVLPSKLCCSKMIFQYEYLMPSKFKFVVDWWLFKVHPIVNFRLGKFSLWWKFGKLAEKCSGQIDCIACYCLQSTAFRKMQGVIIEQWCRNQRRYNEIDGYAELTKKLPRAVAETYSKRFIHIYKSNLSYEEACQFE